MEHWHAIFDAADLIHERCDFLVANSQIRGLDIVQVNDFLHSTDHPEPWPPYLVAFASNGCGDYFAYDTRVEPARIVYIDPDRSIRENLGVDDAFVFDSFASWHEAKTHPRT